MKIGFLDRKSTAEKIIYGIVFVLFTLFALSYLYIFFWDNIYIDKVNFFTFHISPITGAVTPLFPVKYKWLAVMT